MGFRGTSFQYRNLGDTPTMVIRPSTSEPDTASLFVGDKLIHIPKADALLIASMLYWAAGGEVDGT